MPLEVQQVKDLMKSSVNIANKTIVHGLIESNILVPLIWRREVLLRHHYLLFFDDEWPL